jgi:translation elongation factor EF-G
MAGALGRDGKPVKCLLSQTVTDRAHAPCGLKSEIRAAAQFAALLGYTTTLRSLTQGRGQFSMEFLRFDTP